MNPFNAHHIRVFNQRCKHLSGDGKVVFTNKECRDLQAELLEAMVRLLELEQKVKDLQKGPAATEEVVVEMLGSPFK